MNIRPFSQLCSVAVIFSLPAPGICQESIQKSSAVTSAREMTRAYEKQVARLTAEYEGKLSAVDADFKARVMDLRASLLSDLKALQDGVATHDLDDAVEIRDIALPFESEAVRSPHEEQVAAERKVGVFLQIRPNAKLSQRLHLLSANGRSMVIQSPYLETAFGKWHADGDHLHFEMNMQTGPGRQDVTSEVATIVVGRDGGEYTFTDSTNPPADADHAYVNARGLLVMGDPRFLIPRAGEDTEECGARRY